MFFVSVYVNAIKFSQDFVNKIHYLTIVLFKKIETNKPLDKLILGYNNQIIFF